MWYTSHFPTWKSPSADDWHLLVIYKPALQPGLKLVFTPRFLASGATYHSLSFAFSVPHNTISMFVNEVLQAIVDEYGDEVISVPDNPDAWRELSNNSTEVL